MRELDTPLRSPLFPTKGLFLLDDSWTQTVKIPTGHVLSVYWGPGWGELEMQWQEELARHGSQKDEKRHRSKGQRFL
jgi:hypothetical protein